MIVCCKQGSVGEGAALVNFETRGRCAGPATFASCGASGRGVCDLPTSKGGEADRERRGGREGGFGGEARGVFGGSAVEVKR